MSVRAPDDVGPLAPGAPGMPPRWTSSAKSAVGTALDARSRVWFTVSHGIVDEVYYPRVDQANTRDFGLLLAGPDGEFHEEKRDATSVVTWLADGVPAFRVVNTALDGRWRVTKSVFTHPAHDVLLQTVRVDWLDAAVDPAAWRVFALLAPHVENGGAGNDAWVGEDRGITTLLAGRGGTALALGALHGWRDATAGYVGASDGWQDVHAHGRLTTGARRATDGNVALCGELALAPARVAGPASGAPRSARTVLALGFGRTSAQAALRVRLALADDVRAVRRAYVAGWRRFQRRGRPLAAPLGVPDAPGDARDLTRASVAALRTHEDRSAPGALVASLSIPWGQAKGDEDLGGYHLVWPRDLVESAGALLAAGHHATARRALRFLQATQHADGHWSQNCWLDGTPYWNGVQMDETAFPILLADLAWREGALHARRAATVVARRGTSGGGAPNDGAALRLDPWPMVRRAAAFLLRHGPVTAQDRWEEDAGYSPFTIAVEVAALVAAAACATRVGDAAAAAVCLDAADAWNAGIERWTYVRDTQLARAVGVAGYYARIAPPEIAAAPSPTGPDAGWVPIKNREDPGLRVPYDTLVSPDALALVRFGLRRADDPRILDTLRVIDATLRSDTPTGPAWHRYTGDGYGERADGAAFDGTGIGRAWPLLAGERGHWALAAGDAAAAARLLHVMAAQASDGGMLPEQVWDAPDVPAHELATGRPAGSAMPLAWAHAEYVKLVRSLADGQVFDLPPDAAARYAGAASPLTPRAGWWARHHRVRAVAVGQRLRVLLAAPGRVRWRAGWGDGGSAESVEPLPGVHVAELDVSRLAAGVQVTLELPGDDACPDGEGWPLVVEPEG